MRQVSPRSAAKRQKQSCAHLPSSGRRAARLGRGALVDLFHACYHRDGRRPSASRRTSSTFPVLLVAESSRSIYGAAIFLGQCRFSRQPAAKLTAAVLQKIVICAHPPSSGRRAARLGCSTRIRLSRIAVLGAGRLPRGECSAPHGKRTPNPAAARKPKKGGRRAMARQPP